MSRHIKKGLSAILVGCMLVGASFAQSPVSAQSAAPISKVTVTFTGDTTTSKGFTWYTGASSTGSDLEVVEKTGTSPDFKAAKKYTGFHAVSTHSPAEHVHKAEATGLKPHTTYYFRVGDAKLNIWSETGTFRTAAKDGAFTFVDIADTQGKTEDEALLSGETTEIALKTVKDAAFIMHNGDIVDKGSDEQQWDWLLKHSQKSLLHTTIAPAAGNHEAHKNSFIEHFHLRVPVGSNTTTGAYYSFDYANAHFIVLNTNEDSEEYRNFTPAQINWMKKDVEAARKAGAEWIIVNMHKGPYTTSNHATDKDIMGKNGVRNKVAPLMSELGIDLVLQGHDHIYARTKPIQSSGTAKEGTKITETYKGQSIEYNVNPDGTIFMIPATAGAKAYYKNKKIDPAYFNLFEVADENHAGKYGNEPGYEGEKARPVRGAIQNFVGITIEGRKLTAVTYEIDRVKQPDKDDVKPYIIDTFGIKKEDRAENEAFADVSKDHWAFKEIHDLTRKQITKGYGNGYFRPDKVITREQAARMLYLALGLKEDEQQEKVYKDTAGSPFEKEILAVTRKGIFSGNGNGYFRPKKALTRAESASILQKAFALQANGVQRFKDVPETHWAYGAIQALSFRGITSGVGDGRFAPDNSITRAQYAAFLSRALQLSSGQ